MSTHKSSDYKLTAVKYFLDNNVSQLDTCKIFNCNPRNLFDFLLSFFGNSFDFLTFLFWKLYFPFLETHLIFSYIPSLPDFGKGSPLGFL